MKRKRITLGGVITDPELIDELKKAAAIDRLVMERKRKADLSRVENQIALAISRMAVAIKEGNRERFDYLLECYNHAWNEACRLRRKYGITKPVPDESLNTEPVQLVLFDDSALTN